MAHFRYIQGVRNIQMKKVTRLSAHLFYFEFLHFQIYSKRPAFRPVFTVSAPRQKIRYIHGLYLTYVFQDNG